MQVGVCVCVQVCVGGSAVQVCRCVGGSGVCAGVCG